MKEHKTRVDPLRKLVSERLQAPAPAPHPDADLLAAFADHALGRDEHDQVLAHLSDCPGCREILYLALPKVDNAQTVLSFKPSRARRFRLHWATFIGLAGIVTALVTVRYEFLTAHSRPSSATIAAPVSTYARVVEEKRSVEADRAPAPVDSKKAKPAPADETRPGFKAMHAKPANSLDFDQSGQVHLRAQAPPATPPEAPSQASASRSNDFPSGASAYAKKSRLAQPGAMAQVDALESNSPAAAVVGGVMNLRVASDAKQAVHGEAKSVALQDGTVSTTIRRLDIAPVTASAFDWTLSPEGAVLRSSDEGKSWEALSSLQGGPFAALSSVGPQVWVGGKNGVLYHSDDSGKSWHEILPAVGVRRLQSNITRIEFSDPLKGVVSTVDGELWTTSDGGLTWREN